MMPPMEFASAFSRGFLHDPVVPAGFEQVLDKAGNFRRQLAVVEFHGFGM